VQLTAQKVGYVSTETIQENFDEAKQAEERLEGLVKGWKDEINQMNRDIEEIELDMKKNRLIWGDKEREQRERELEEKKRYRDKFAREKFEPGGEYDQNAEEMYGYVYQKVYLAIQQVAAKEGYDIVWDKSSQPLVYVNAKYDLTVKVMKQLGIDANELERKQLEVIDADPRNKKEKETRRRRSRRRSTSRRPPAEPEETAPSEDAAKPPTEDSTEEDVPR
jgi:Skp family chaperone for outer membrane proteins